MDSSTVFPSTFLTETFVEGLQSRLHGQLIRPGEPTYEQARRVWNGMIDRHPALIVRCADRDDVARAITFARSHHLSLSVRGGGHSTAGFALCEDGLVIDLSPMKGVTVDVVQRTARAEPGLTLSELCHATQPFGLATTTGIVSGTGIAGLTLGGGIGWLDGKYGLTCDNVLSFDVVTADGEFLHANSHENSDLYWALRGGGGNFGVVTAFTYQLHPVGQVLAGMVVHPLPVAREALRFYREFANSAPDELTAYAALITTPDGHPAVAIVLCYCGPLDEGMRVVAPVRQFGPPIMDLIRPMDYSEVITLLDAANPDGNCYYEKGAMVKSLTDECLDVVIQYAREKTSPLSAVLIQHVHGAASRVPSDATAFVNRDEYFIVLNIAQWKGGEATPHMQWARSAWQALQPYAMGGTYVNFMAIDEQARVRNAYGQNYPQLVKVKNRYDPGNLFRSNQNIKPTSEVK